MIKGSCLCGAITIKLAQIVGNSDACHCRECRKWTGHFLASVDVKREAISIIGEEHLNWYQSSEKVRRGFCRHCGSSLLFDPLDKKKHDWLAIALGCFDGDTGITLEKHIFVAEKGDYYQISDNLPQRQQ